MITNNDKQILRKLAKEQLEIANSQQMTELKKLWSAHNAGKGSRPTVKIETFTFANEAVVPFLKCEDSAARELEFDLRLNQVNNLIFKDDTIIEPFFPITHYAKFKAFDLETTTELSSVKTSIGYHYKEIIKDLQEDFHLLKPATFTFDYAERQSKIDFVNENIGDILPPKIVGRCLYSCPTQEIVHIMGMENMLIAMMDYPELFKQMMQMLTDDYLRFYRYIEQQNLLKSTVEGEFVGQGSYAFTQELPSNLNKYESKDVWGFMDSQESVGISPEMFDEFIFPSYLRLSEEFGLLSYGCCEPVDPLWNLSLSRFKNLRKISISPWCNQEIMGEKLANTNVIFHRKPSANLIGVNKQLNENEVRDAIKKTVKASKNCKLEIVQRDVYTVHNDLEKVKKYVKIIKQETENSY